MKTGGKIGPNRPHMLYFITTIDSRSLCMYRIAAPPHVQCRLASKFSSDSARSLHYFWSSEDKKNTQTGEALVRYFMALWSRALAYFQ